MAVLGLYLVACLLLVMAGLAKAWRPDDTARAMGPLLRLRPDVARPFVRVLAGGEAALGVVAFWFPAPVTAGAVGASYVVFAGVVVRPRLRARPLPGRACFGTPDTPASWTHVVVDLVLAGASLAVAATAAGDLVALLSQQPAQGVPLVLTVAVGAWLVRLALVELARLWGVRTQLSNGTPGRR